MADNAMRFILSFLAESAGLKNAQELAEQLGTSLDDAEDAGKQMAAALKAAADKAQKDLADTVEMADKLAQALGPELTAKVNVDEIAGKMRAVGMSIEDVEANADSFRQSLGQMADTADQAKARMGGLGDGVKRVGDSSERSRSVMANFTGNAMQEVPLLTGAFGPLNMAVGQFAEYAAEGNIKLKNLLATGAGIGSVAFLMSQFADRAERAAKANAFDADEVKAYAAAMEGADSTVAGILAKLREGQGIMLNWGDTGGQKDITGQLVALGLTAEQTAELIAGGADKIEAWRAAMVESGASAASTAIAAAGLTQQVGYLDEQQANAARSAKFLGAEVEKSLTPMADAYRKTRDLADAAGAAGRKWDEMTDKFNNEDAFANAVLSLQGLDDQLADIQERMNDKENPISGAEAWAEATLAINGVTASVRDTLTELGFMSTALANKFEVLVETGQIDAATEKLQWLIQLAGQMRNPDWFGTNVGRSSPGGSREQSVDGERPIVVQSNVALSINDRTVQEFTAVQQAQQRGQR